MCAGRGALLDRDTLTRHPAVSPGAVVAPNAAVDPLDACSHPAGSSATARDRVAVGPSRQVGVRCGTAERGPAGTRRRPSPVRRRARSIDAPPAPCGPTASCPAPAAPSRTPKSPRVPPTIRSTGNVIARAPTGVVPRPKPPYREGRQLRPLCEEGNRTERLRQAPVVETTHNAEGAPRN